MTDPITTPAQMTTTDEHLLALAKIICAAMTWPSDFGWSDQSDQYRAKCMDAARCVLVAERQKPQHGKEVMPNDEDNSHERPAVSPRLTAGAQAVRVKPLVWVFHDQTGDYKSVYISGGWTISHRGDGCFALHHRDFNEGVDRAYQTPEAAQAAAEADHAARILPQIDAVSVAQVRAEALEEAAKCCEAEADRCDDAVKWGGAPKYIANCKAAAYAMRDRAAAIRAMKGKPE